jgi:hypothetical protein
MTGLETIAGAPTHSLPTMPAPELVDIERLSVGMSPRLGALRESHVTVLQEVLNHLPPILVQRSTMTVIDGAHRLEAHRRAGRLQIPARLLDGAGMELFALAVEANVSHGMPLTLSERKRSAAMLLEKMPERSDRWVASICGLSHSTVAKIRHDPALASVAEPGTRVGRDGRRRSLEGSRRRSLLDTSADRLRPFSAGPAIAATGPLGAHRQGAPGTGLRPSEALGVNDPALRTTPGLVDFARWMEATAVRSADWEPYADTIPIGRLYELADESRRRARSWTDLANTLEQRARRAGRD